MKKLMITIICIVMMLTTSVFAHNEAADNLHVQDNTVDYLEEFELIIDKASLTYYPFIYQKGNDWFNENVIGPADCQEGYLYSKNLNTGVIKQLVSVPVDVFREVENGVYFIHGDTIYFTDYNGEEIKIVYQCANSLQQNILEKYNEELYFVEAEKIIKYNVYNEEKNVLAEVTEVDMLYVRSEDEIVYSSNGEIHYVNNKNNYNMIIEEEAEINQLFINGDWGLITASPADPVDTNLQNIKSTYPSGSYFSTTGARCTHHLNSNSNCRYYNNCVVSGSEPKCKSYSGAIQCVGYAKWAADQYMHKSSWSPVSGDQNDTNVGFGSDSAVALYFANCSTGTYVLLSKSASDDNGFHAMLFVKLTSTSVQSLECNLTLDCKVTYPTRTFAAFRSFAPASSYYVTHKFNSNSTYISYNLGYHKQYCATSSCGGYRLEPHYSQTTGSNATCEACGYVGNIIYSHGY